MRIACKEKVVLWLLLRFDEVMEFVMKSVFQSTALSRFEWVLVVVHFLEKSLLLRFQRQPMRMISKKVIFVVVTACTILLELSGLVIDWNLLSILPCSVLWLNILMWFSL